jgi:hypothetical protein
MTTELVFCPDDFCRSTRIDNELSDARTVSDVNEGYTAKRCRVLHPSDQCNCLTDIFNAEFSALVGSVHIFLFIKRPSKLPNILDF